MDRRARHAELCRSIDQHNHSYYVLDAPTVDDHVYDGLFAELKELERQHPELVDPSSPTQRVGAAPAAGFRKVEHAARMYSLDNVYDRLGLEEFDRRVRSAWSGGESVAYMAEPKIDGASIEVMYRDGQLHCAATRGDGLYGEDVTANLRTIRALPLRIAEARPLTLRGEVFIHREDLRRINEERVAQDEEPFANPRNAAAGSLRLLDPRLSAQRPLRVVFYELVEPWWQHQHEVLAHLRALRLPTHGLERRCADLDAAWAFVERFADEHHRLPYETDGVVLKVDSLLARQELGATARHVRWAIAYKYPAERAQTIVRGIHCDVGRTGVVTPVADLEAVALGGTSVTHASLHNVDYVAAKDVRVGDTVVVEKAGEIIPQVLHVVLALRPAASTPWQPPNHCPACLQPLVRQADEAALRCINRGCPGQLKAALWHFTRRGAMDIERLGPALIEQLVDGGLVANFADIFSLTQHRERLLQLPRMGEKSVDRLLAAIEPARQQRSLAQLLNGLGIPLVGQVAAQHIATRYPTLDALLAEDPAALTADLSELEGIGPKIAARFAGYLADPTQRQMLKALVGLGVRTRTIESTASVDGRLSGQSFCVTGVLSVGRDLVHSSIRQAGGEVHERVTKATKFLVVGDKVGESKRRAAERLGVAIIDEAELRRMLGFDVASDAAATNKEG